MHTRVVPFSTAAIAEAAALIRAGQPVAVPTETVYGLAADATNSEAVTRIYEAKGRPPFNPLIVHVADLAAAERIAVFDDAARKLAVRFWPGPLTLVLPRAIDSPVAALATAGLPTIAVRFPAHRAMRALLEATCLPLAAPSANASGTISSTRAEHVLRSLGGRIALVIDDGATDVGIESTIVAVNAGDIRVLREGPISRDEIAAVVGTKVGRASGDEVTSPGQLASHYAPAKPLRLDAREAETDEWLIGFGDIPGDATLSAGGDLREAAAKLFDLLHEADRSSAARIAVAPVPQHGIGITVNDRLRRAAHV